MKNEQLKLEEFMYISLIGKFYSTDVVNGNKLICFASVDKINNTTPIYITSGENYSETTLLNRIKAFEKKVIMNRELLDQISSNEKENKVNFVGRLKTYLGSLKNEELKSKLNLYNKNIESLAKEDFIEDEEKKLIKSYVEYAFGRLNEDLKTDIAKAEIAEKAKELNIL